MSTASRANMKWTKAEEALLESMWGAFSIEDIAKRLCRSTSSILRKSTRMGLGSRARGTVSLTELAKRAGCCKGTIHKLFRRLNMRPNRLPLRINKCSVGGKNRRILIDFFDAERVLTEYEKLLNS